MLVRFADSVPESERRWIAALVRRCGRLWGFADWEVRVECGDLKRNVVATVAVHPGGSQACVTMDPSRMYDRAVLRTDLIHELWHVPMWGIFAALQDLAAHIPRAAVPIALRAALADIVREVPCAAGSDTLRGHTLICAHYTTLD